MYRFRTPAILNVKVKGQPFFLGGKINVEIGIEHQERVSVREGRMEIICEEVYGTWSSDASVLSKGLHTPVNHSMTFISDTDLEPGLAGTHKLVFTIPEDAPPTIDGQAAKVKWMLKVTLDVRGAFDSVHEEELIVSLPLSLEPSDSLLPVDEIVSKSPYQQCELALSLTPNHARTGGLVKGVFRIQMWEKVDAGEVRVELERSEKAGGMGGSYAVDKKVLLERESLDERMVYRWPFQLQVPETHLPTVSTAQGSSVEWRVRCVITRRAFPPRRWEVGQVVQIFTS